MKDPIYKTNAARHLDALHIPYVLVAYHADEADLSAVHVAQSVGENIEQVYKTLVLKGDKSEFFVCVIPGADELDLKAAARASGNKSCAMLPVKELMPVTGYIRGGCSPLAMKKRFPTYIQEDCLRWDFIYISAGKRGLQIKICPRDLLQATGASAVALTQPRRKGDPENI